jgi:hypothetical protein
MISEIELERMKICCALLPEPGDQVVRQCITEIERLRQGLKDIVYPLDMIKREFTAFGYLSEDMAWSYSIDPDFLRSIASTVLGE